MVRLAFYGDDFTGSVDSLLQARRTGLDGVLVTSPDAAAAVDSGAHDAVGIAGIARSLPTAELESEVRPAFAALLGLAPDVLQYKVCSTADSSPEVGSIGRVIEIVRQLVGAAPVPVLFAQPDFGRWTVFSHHFATDRGEVYRIDRQPTMANHPVTPATESDLRVHLAAQTGLTVGGLHWTSYDGDPEGRALARDTEADDVLVLDALTDSHLRHIGVALANDARAGGTRFVVGSGGLTRAFGLGAAAVAPQGGEMSLKPPRGRKVNETVAPAAERTLVLSGSASALTWRQVQAAAAAGFEAIDLFSEGAHDRTLAALANGSDAVVHSTSPGSSTTAASEDVEARLAAIGTDALRRAPRTRLVVAGGDTSGNVLRRMGVASLHIETNPWGMVSLCRADGPAAHLRGGIEVALKGGQMGHETLFDDIRSGTPLRA